MTEALSETKNRIVEALRPWESRQGFNASDGATDVMSVIAGIVAQGVEAEYERDEMKRNYDHACLTVAEMHKAAVGEVTGPKRGVVEDVEDLRLRMVTAEDLLSTAWGIICNVGAPAALSTSTPPYADGWEGQGAEWAAAVVRLRTDWHAYLGQYAQLVNQVPETPL